MVAILMPHAELSTEDAGELAPRLTSLQGRTIGIVNNSWRCMDVIANELDTVLSGRFEVAGIDERRISAAQTLPIAAVEEMASTCDAVVVGIGN